MLRGLGVFVVFGVIAFESVAATLAPSNCPEHVERTYQKRLKNLADEGIIALNSEGDYQPLWAAADLYKDPRFRNFPAISLEQIRWCPQMAAVESSLSFLSKVGFNPQNIDSYFKKLLYSAPTDLAVAKDQVGLSNGRQSVVDWAQGEASKKAFAAHYAMAIYKDPNKDQKITARAGSTFLGVFQDRAIFTLPYHALALVDSEKKCEDFEFYFPKTPKHPLKGVETLFVLPNVDVVFCSLKLAAEHAALKPATLDTNPVPKRTRLFTLGVGTDKTTQKLQLTIDDSDECMALVDESGGATYTSGVLKATTQRWAMGCDVSEGNSGDGVYNKATGQLVAIITSRAAYTYASLAQDVFTSSLSKDRLYLETSHFVPFSQILKTLGELPLDSLTKNQREFREWILKL